MEISQKRDSSRTRYVFHDDRLEYAWKDSSGSRTFSVPYTAISRDRETLTERNVWLRNVGILWLIIGGIYLVAMANGAENARGWMWAVLGAGCYAVYRFRSTRYTIVPSEKGNLLVIDAKDGERILDEIESRRAAQFRAEYDFFPEGDSPEQLRNRFKWLHREGALSEEELEKRLAAIQVPGPVADPEPEPEPELQPEPTSGRSLH